MGKPVTTVMVASQLRAVEIMAPDSKTGIVVCRLVLLCGHEIFMPYAMLRGFMTKTTTPPSLPCNFCLKHEQKRMKKDHEPNLSQTLRKRRTQGKWRASKQEMVIHKTTGLRILMCESCLGKGHTKSNLPCVACNSRGSMLVDIEYPADGETMSPPASTAVKDAGKTNEIPCGMCRGTGLLKVTPYLPLQSHPPLK
jgi:hypothetical protein